MTLARIFLGALVKPLLVRAGVVVLFAVLVVALAAASASGSS